jgi:hypothetical protein
MYHLNSGGQDAAIQAEQWLNGLLSLARITDMAFPTVGQIGDLSYT